MVLGWVSLWFGFGLALVALFGLWSPFSGFGRPSGLWSPFSALVALFGLYPTLK
jgi:hypothetical protein